MKVLLGW